MVFVPLADPLDAPHRLRQQLRRRPLPLVLRLPPGLSGYRQAK